MSTGDDDCGFESTAGGSVSGRWPRGARKRRKPPAPSQRTADDWDTPIGRALALSGLTPPAKPERP